LKSQKNISPQAQKSTETKKDLINIKPINVVQKKKDSPDGKTLKHTILIEKD